MKRLAGWLGRWNYDVRVRSYPVVREIRRADPAGHWTVLDVGSGESGLPALLPGRRVVGLDRELAGRPSGLFIRASALHLPFEDQSWDIVTSIDVIEHLNASQRVQTLSEILRVSRRMAIVAFPFGEGARRADADHAAAHLASGSALPPWLDEHLRQPHPEAGNVEEVLLAGGGLRVDSMGRRYNESLRLQRMHRFLSRRFTPGYRVFSVLCGLAAPWLARPIPSRDAYRCMVTVTLKPTTNAEPPTTPRPESPASLQGIPNTLLQQR